jgi:aspartate/methionine/tyrosine aminotransferase
MNPFAAQRMKRIEQSGIRRMLEEAMAMERSGREVIHMEIGRTDFDTPPVVKEAAKKALDDGFVHYTSSMGVLELRQAIAEKLRKENGIEIKSENEILVTAGASEAVMLTVLTVLDPGDEILIPEPMYLFYLDLGEYAGARTIPLPLSPNDGFQITRERLESFITEKTKAVLLNSPHNPTGHVLSLQSLQAVAETAQERDLIVISDEIYEKIIYEPYRHYSIASLPGMKERTVTMNSFSKSHAMDGWRIGYLAAPADLVWELEKGQQHFIINPPSFAQVGAIEALKHGDGLIRHMVAEYSDRRRLMMEMVDAYPRFSYFPPQGAFYFWLYHGLKKMDGWELVDLLLEKDGVAVTPGEIFGLSGIGYLRISYSNSQENLRKGMTRILETLSKFE